MQSPFLLGHFLGDGRCMGESGLLCWGLDAKAQGLRDQPGGMSTSLSAAPASAGGEESHDGLWEKRDGGNFVLKPLTLVEGGGGGHFSTGLKGYWATRASGYSDIQSTHGAWRPQPQVETSGSSFRVRADTQVSPTPSQGRVLNSPHCGSVVTPPTLLRP